ncbi:unnamed protein product [Choristocarpus tenellus]
MDNVKAFLLQQWTYGPEVCLSAFALLGAAKVRKVVKASGGQMFWAQSLVLTFMVGFGGGILAPFLLGKPPVIFTNDLLVPLVTVAWFLVNLTEGVIFRVLGTPVINQVMLVLGECFRANAMCGVVLAANKVISASKYYPIPLWGPILLGTIGACGGMFLPLDKGLQGLKNGAPWPMQSAFYGSMFFHLTVHDPNVGPYLRQGVSYVFEGENIAEVARMCVVLFFCSMAIAQSFLGPTFNPFMPVHNILYNVTGIPRAGVAMPTATATAPSAPVATADKPKGE